MGMQHYLGLAYLVIGLAAASTTTTSTTPPPPHLLGSKECTWGPSYWCTNITYCCWMSCHKALHTNRLDPSNFTPDHSSVCETCLKMVKEARDQLLSNETQEEIKEVFEGSCKLLPIKPIANECCKLADDFIPELVDALASQMNPQVVCSVAGLCNNERVQNLLNEQDRTVTVPKSRGTSNNCKGCHTVVDLVEKKFQSSNRDQVLQGFLQVCGRLGSLSDSCSNIIISYFNEIYKHLQENLNAEEFCLMAGECSAMFHTHANVEITPMSNVGVLPVEDDLPCDLCEQLVKHLQDVLIANTTEEEFHKVLLGLCKQTKSFKEECTSIAEQYYPMIYDFLVHELNGTVLCSFIGICPGPGLLQADNNTPIMPLIPIETVDNAMLSAHPIVPIGRVNVNKPGSSVKVMQTQELPPLPIERLVPQTLTIIGNTELCEFCEYFLHFVQKAITEPATEDEIKHVVDAACNVLPRSVNDTCRQFVDTYGSAFIALLAQDIDPSVLCPKLSLCPSADTYKIHDVEIFMHRNKGDKPNCPLCLFAIQSLEQIIKNKKTESEIRTALNGLCSHLPKDLAAECNDFVETYTEEIVEACIADLDPQQICVYLKICTDPVAPQTPIINIEFGGHVDTNEIPDSTSNGKMVPKVESDSGVCVLCEFVMSQLENELKNNATDEEIKDAVLNICKHLPKSISKECTGFVRQYADLVIQMLIQSLDPSEICTEIKLCKKAKKPLFFVNDLMLGNDDEPEIEISSPQCAVCKLVMTQIESMLQGSITEAKIIKAVHTVCNWMPRTESNECNQFINKNGDKIIELLKLAIQPSEICSLMFFCAAEVNAVKMEIRRCTVCEAAVDVMDKIVQNNNINKKLEHIIEKTCRGLPEEHQHTCNEILFTHGHKMYEMLSHGSFAGEVCKTLEVCGSHGARVPRDTPAVGGNKCTWGPGFWCASEENANQCGAGAVEHCKTKVWNTKPAS